MACTTLTTITKGCDTNVGGIREVYIYDMEDMPTSAVGASATTGFITSMGSSASPAIPVAFEFLRNSSNYTEEGAIDLVNGSSYVTQTLNLVFTRREAAKSKSLRILGEGQRYLGALVKDANGLYWLFQDLQLTATGEGSGTAKSDGSKYSVTLTAEWPELAYEVSATDAEDFITQGYF